MSDIAEALRELVTEYELFMKWLGPCDHDTGCCHCKEQAILDRAREALASQPPPAEGEILPCPFCGRQPNSRWWNAAGEGSDDCGYWGIDCCRAFAHEDSEAAAIAAWNRRTLSSRSQEGREGPTHPQIIDALEAYHYYEDPNDPKGLRQDFNYDRMEATLRAALKSAPTETEK